MASTRKIFGECEGGDDAMANGEWRRSVVGRGVGAKGERRRNSFLFNVDTSDSSIGKSAVSPLSSGVLIVTTDEEKRKRKPQLKAPRPFGLWFTLSQL